MPNDVKNSESVIYNENEILISSPVNALDSFVVYVRPEDKIKLNFDLKQVKVTFVNGDVDVIFPNGARISISSLAAIYYSDSNVEIFDLNSKKIALEDLLKNYEVLDSNALLILSNKDNYELIDTKEIINRIVLGSDNDGEFDGGNPIAGIGQLSTPTTGKVSLTVDKTAFSTLFKQNDSTDPFPVNIYTSDLNGDTDYSNYAAGTRTITQEPILSFTWYFGYDYTSKNETIAGVQYSSYVLKSVRPGTNKDPLTQIDTIVIDASQNVSGSQGASFDYHSDSFDKTLEIGYGKGVKPTDIEIVGLNVQDFGNYSPEEILSIENASTAILRYDPDLQDSSGKPTGGYVVTNLDYDGKISLNLHIPFNMNAKYDLEFNVHYVDPVSGNLVVMSITKTMVIMPVSSQKDLSSADFVLSSSSPGVNFIGTGNDDFVILGAPDNSADGGRGADYFALNIGDDEIKAGFDDDVVMASSGVDIIYANGEVGASTDKDQILYNNGKFSSNYDGQTVTIYAGTVGLSDNQKKYTGYNTAGGGDNYKTDTNKMTQGINLYYGLDYMGEYINSVAPGVYDGRIPLTDVGSTGVFVQKQQGGDIILTDNSTVLIAGTRYDDVFTIYSELSQSITLIGDGNSSTNSNAGDSLIFSSLSQSPTGGMVDTSGAQAEFNFITHALTSSKSTVAEVKFGQIEKFAGGNNDDLFIGDNFNLALDGDDTTNPADVHGYILNGGGGFDTVDYNQSSITGVTVSAVGSDYIRVGKNTSGAYQADGANYGIGGVTNDIDKMNNVERIVGTSGDDTFLGSSSSKFNVTYDGTTSGTDKLSYGLSGGSVTVVLGADFNPSVGTGSFSGVYIYKYNPTVVDDYNYGTMVAANPKSDYTENMSTIELTDHEDLIFLELSALKADVNITEELVNVDQNSILSNRDTVSWYDVDDGTGGAVDTSYYTVDTTLVDNKVSINNSSANTVNIDSIVFDNNGSSTTQAVVKKYVGGVGGTMFYGSTDTNYTFIGHADTNVAPAAKDTLSYENADITDLDEINFLIGSSGQITKITVNDGQYVDDYENITVFVGSEGDDKFVYADVNSSGSGQDVVDIIKNYEIDGKGQGTKGDSLEFSKISSTTMNTLIGIHFSTKATNTTENMYFLSSPSDKFGAKDIEGIVATVGSDYYVGTVNYVSTFDGGSSFVNVDLKTLTSEDEGKEALTHFSNFLKAYYSNNSTVLNPGVSDSNGDLQGDIMDFGESAKIEIKLDSSNSNGGSYVTENSTDGSADDVTGRNLTYFSNVEIFYAFEIEAVLGGGASTIGSYAFIAGNSTDGTGGSVTLLYNGTSSNVSSSISVDFLSMTTSRGSNKDTFLANNVSIVGTSTDDTFIIGYSEEAFAEIGVLNFYISGGGGIEILDFSNIEEGFTTTSFVNLVTNNRYEVYDPVSSPSTAVAVYDFDPGSIYSYSLTHYADQLVYVATPFDNMTITVDFLDNTQEPQKKDSFSYKDYSSTSNQGVIVTGVVGSTSSVNVSREGYVDNFKNVQELTLTRYKDVLNYSDGMTVEVNADAGVSGDSVEDEVNFGNINDKVVITFSNGSDSSIVIGNTSTNVSNLKGFDSYVASSGDTQYIIDSSYDSNTNNLKLTGSLRPGATSSISFTGFTSGINYDMENKTVAAKDSNATQKNYKIEAIAIANINLSDLNDTVIVGDDGTQTTFNFQGKESTGYDKLDYSAVNTDMKFDVMASYVATENFVQYFTASATDSVDLVVNDKASFEISSFDSSTKYVNNIIINSGVGSEMIFSASTVDANNVFTGVAIFVDNGVMKFSDIAKTGSNTNDMVKVTDAAGTLQKTDLYLTDYKDIVEIDQSSIGLYNNSFASINGSVSEEFYGSSKDELKLTNFNGAGSSISFDTGTGELSTASGSLIVKGFGVVSADLQNGGGTAVADTITIIGSYSSYDYDVNGDGLDKVILDYSNLSYVDVRVESLKVVLNTGGSNSDDLSFDNDLNGNVEVKLTNNADNIAVEFASQGDVKFNLGTYNATFARDSIKFTNISNSTMDMTGIYNDNVSNTASKGMIGTVIFEEDSTAANTNLVFNADGYDPLYDKMVYTVNSRFDNSKISYENSSNGAGSTSTTGILLDVSSSIIYKQLDYTDPLSIDAPINRTDKYDILQRSSSFADDGKLVFYDVVGTKNDDYMVGGVSGVRFDGVMDEGFNIASNQYGDVTTYSKNTGFGIEVDLKAISTGGLNDGYVEITKFVGGQAVVGSEDYIIQVESLIGTDVDDVFYADETGATNVEYVSGGSGNDVYSYANFTAAKTGQITNVNGFEIIELTTYADSIEFDNTLIKESFTVKGGGGDDSVSYAKMNTAVLSLGYVVDGGKSYVRINKSDTTSADVYVDKYEDVKSFDLKNDNIVNTVLDENLITDNISVLVSYNSDGFDSDGKPTTANVYSLLDLSNTTSNFIIEMNIGSSGAYSAGTMGFAIVGNQLEYDRFFGYGSLELSGSGSTVTLAVSAVDTASRSLNTVVDSVTYKSSDLIIFKMESNITSFKLDNNAGTFVVNNNGVENFTNFTQYKYLEVKQGTYDIVADNVNSCEYDFSDSSNVVSSSAALAVNLDYSNLNYSVAAVYDTGSSSLTIAEKVATPGQVPKKSDTIKGVDRVTTIVLTSYDDSFDAAGKYNSNLSVDMGGGYKDSVTFASSTNALDAIFAQGQFTAGAGSSNVTIINNEVYGLTTKGDSVSLEDNTFDNLFIDGLAGDDTIKFASNYFNMGVDSLLFVVSTKNVGTVDQYDSLQLLGNGTTSSNAEFISFEKINYTGMIVTNKELSYIFKSNTLTITEVDYTGSTMNDVVSNLDFSDTSGSAIIFNITANGGINVGDVANPSSISFIGILSDTNRTQLTLSSVDDTINIDYTTVLKGDLSIIGDGLGSDKVVFSNQTTVTSMDFVASGVDSVQVSSASNLGFNLSTKGINEFSLESNTVTEFTFSRENVSSNVKSLTVDLTESSFAAQNSKLTLDYSKSSQDNLSLTETVVSNNTQIVMTDGSSSSVMNDTFLLKNNLAHNVEVILSTGSNNYAQAFGSTQSSIVYTIDFNGAVSGAGDKLILSDSATSGKVANISSSSSIGGYIDVTIESGTSTIFTGKGLNVVDITSFGQVIEISSDVFTSSNFVLIDGTSASPSNMDKNIKIETTSSGSYEVKKSVNGAWGFHDATTKNGFDLSTDNSNSNDVAFIIESSFDTIHQSYASAADVASSPILDISNSAANGNIQLDLNFKVNDLFLLGGVSVDGYYLIMHTVGYPNMNVDIDINIKGGVTNTVQYFSGENINLLNNENVADPASIELIGFSVSSSKFSLVYDYSNGVKNTKILHNNADGINSIVGFDNFKASSALIEVVIYKENSDYNADTITEVDSITFKDFVAGDSIIVDMSGAQGFVSVKELGGTSKSMNITGASNNNQVTTISFGDSSDKIVFSDVLFSDLDVSMGQNKVTGEVDEIVIKNYTGAGGSETVNVTGNTNGGFDLSSGGGSVNGVEKIAIDGVNTAVVNFVVSGATIDNIFNLDAGGIADVNLAAVSFSNTILSLNSQGSSFYGYDINDNKIANVSNVSTIKIGTGTELEINADSNFESFRTISFYGGYGDVNIVTSSGALDIDVTGSVISNLHVNTIGATDIRSEYFNVVNFSTVDLTNSNGGSNNIDVTTTVATSLTYIMNPVDTINFASGSVGGYVNGAFEVSRSGVTDYVIGTNHIGNTITRDENGNSFSDEVIFGFEGTYESYLQDREEMLNEKGEFDVELGVSDDELTMDYLVDGEIDTGMGVDDIYLNFEIDSNILFKVEGNDLILIDQENGVETVFENSVNDNIFDNEGNLIASNGELLNSQYQENNIGNTNGDSSDNMIFNDFTTSDYYSYYYGSEYNDITSGETSLITENTVENVEEEKDDEKDDEKINMQDIMNYLENNDNSIDDLLSNMQDILENTEVDINVSFDFINEKFEEDNSYIFHTTNKEEEKDSNKQMHVEIMKNFSNMSGGQSY